MQRVLAELIEGRTLSAVTARAAIESILRGEANESQVGAMLALLAQRGPTHEELVGGALAMRAHATPVPVPDDPAIRGALIDTCGTGGTPKRFNVSTAAAFVVAGARGGTRRVYVAKHGGRSRSGRGSAEVLAALGVDIDAPPAVQARCLERAGVCFAFAVNHHPAMRFAAGPRKSLGFPTIFNLLGPLSNPAGVRRQIIGVYAPGWVEPMARALAALGAERAMVVHGLDGLDELSTAAPSLIAHVESGEVRFEQFDPSPLGLAVPAPGALEAHTLEQAAEMLRTAIEGRAGPARDVVAFNAAAGLVVGGACRTITEGLDLAARSIDSGGARDALAELIAGTRQTVV